MAYRRNGLKMEDLHSVKVDNLPADCSNEDLQETFGKFGEVQDVYIPQDYYTRKNKGFGFVRFQHEDEARDATDASDLEVAGSQVKAMIAQRQKPPPSRGGRGRGRDDSRRRGGRSNSRRRGGRQRDSRSRGRAGRSNSRGRGRDSRRR